MKMNTNIYDKNVIAMKKLILLFAMIICVLTLLTYITCKKEKYDDVTYYKTIGTGHVFMYDSTGGYPIPGAKIIITTILPDSGGLFGISCPVDTVTTDETGKYQVRFIKRTKLRDATYYYIQLEWKYAMFNTLRIYPAEVKNAPNGILVIDTIKLYENEHKYL
jgi:hypothetical protein